MSSGTILKLGVSFTDTDRPTIPIPEPILSSGSLLLLDPMSEQKSWDAGVPASGASLPNLAWAPAAAMIGAGTEGSLAAQFSNSLTLPNGRAERSAKGGLHVAIKQTAYTVSQNANIAQAAVRDYIVANAASHSFFMSLWGRYTHDDAFTISGYGQRLVGINAAAADWFTIRRGNSTAFAMLPSTTRVGSRTKATRALEPFIINGAMSSIPGTPSTSQTLAIWQTGPSTGGNVVQPSWVLYRLYIEDLTVSGRTYAEVDALDAAQYNADVLTAGGRYNADTYTDPLTL